MAEIRGYLEAYETAVKSLKIKHRNRKKYVVFLAIDLNGMKSIKKDMISDIDGKGFYKKVMNFHFHPV